MGRAEFDWPEIRDGLKGIDSRGPSFNEGMTTRIAKINALQKKLQVFSDNLKKAANEINATIEEYGVHLQSVQENITRLHDLGVDDLEIAKVGSISKMFSGKQKEIKTIKLNITRDIDSVNKIKGELPDLLGEALTLDNKIESSTRANIKKIPHEQQITTYLKSIQAAQFIGNESADTPEGELAAGKYPSFIENGQFEMYGELKALLWKFYHSQIDSTISHVGYLRRVLNFDELGDTLNESSLEFLHSMGTHLLNPPN